MCIKSDENTTASNSHLLLVVSKLTQAAGGNYCLGKQQHRYSSIVMKGWLFIVFYIIKGIILKLIFDFVCIFWSVKKSKIESTVWEMLTDLTTMAVSVAETVLLTFEDVAPRAWHGNRGGWGRRGVEGRGDGEALVTARHVLTGCVTTIAQLSLTQTVQYCCAHLSNNNHSLL